ncbi:MAG: pectinesterase, partial [Clostridium sp.]
MNSLDREILDFLKKASKRIKAGFLLNISIVGLKLLLCLSLCLLLISLFITIPYVEEASIVIISIGMVGTLVYGFVKAPKKNKVALIVDSKGLKERVTTSLELIGQEDKISVAQKEDTILAIKNYDLKKNLKIKTDRKQLLLIVGLIAMCVMTSFIPTGAKKNADNIKEFNKYKSEVVKKIEKEKEEIDKLEGLDEKEKEELKKILEDAKKELKEGTKKTELNKTLERLEKKLEDKKEKVKSEEGKKALESVKKELLEDFNKKKEEEAKKDLNKIVNELAKKEETKKLADALMSDNKDEIAKALGEMKKSLPKMSSAQKSKLSNALKNAAQEMSDEDLAKALEEASDSVMDGELSDEDLAKALASLKKASEKSKSDGKGAGEGQGEGDGDGNGSGSGKGQGSGSGSGEGGSGGQGWDTGSTTGNEKDGDKKSGEQVYIPGRDVGNDENLSGNK